MKVNQRIRFVRRAILMSVASVAVAEAAVAQESSALAALQPEAVGAAGDEIIVTARKRAETLIEVPVTVTAVGAAELKNRAISNIDAVARIVPTLIAGEGGGTVQGGIISIRGLAGADNNPLNDQAVSFNIDGVGIGRATVRRFSDFDIQQIEVLKGPQALFFGKNSPAGIISIRTADPTPAFEAQIRAGYEFKAREIRTEAHVSGPLTESLGFRLAGLFSDMEGWSKNYVPRDVPAALVNNIHPPLHSRAPNKRDWAIRGTLRYDDGGPFDARLKFTYGKLTGAASTANTQFVSCPLGLPQAHVGLPAGLPIDDCKADDRVGVGDFHPNVDNAFPGVFPDDGHTFINQWQALGSMELNYKLSDDITLTSVTGYYKVKLRNFGNFTQNYYEDGVLPRQFLPSLNRLEIREITEEARITTDFDAPINLMIGGLYQDSHAINGSSTARNTLAAPPLTPTFVNNYLYVQDGKAWSAFGQVMWEILPTVELSGGVRYSHETKELPGLFTGTAAAPQLAPITAAGLDRKVSFNDWSPEATISYKPTPDMNLYASYKRGFLSGGFSALAPTAGVIAGTQQVTYDQQITKGFEVGFKTALLDRALRFNIAAYTYKTSGLQVGVTTQGVQQELRNAGSVRTKGVEADFNYRTPVEGLSVNAAVAYTKGKYLEYLSSCYRGQPSTTCFNQISPVTGQIALLQDLAGQPLVRAPKWSGNAGFNYETPITDGLKIGLLGSMNFSSKYFTDTTNTPGGLQDSYTLFDATIRVADQDDRWEAALIGRNLTDKYYFVRSSDTPFTGTNPGCAPLRPDSPANCLTGGVPNASVTSPLLGDTAAYVNRGREIMLRLTVKFGR